MNLVVGEVVGTMGLVELAELAVEKLAQGLGLLVGEVLAMVLGLALVPELERPVLELQLLSVAS